METETQKPDYKQAQAQSRKQERQAYSLKSGNTWNPLLRYPRNRDCYCGSGIKHKKCCINNKSPFVSKAQAEEFSAYMTETGAK